MNTNYEYGEGPARKEDITRTTLNKNGVSVYKEPTYDILLEMAYQLNLIPRGDNYDIIHWVPILKNYYNAAVKAGAVKL
jgi:hypothetical protein